MNDLSAFIALAIVPVVVVAVAVGFAAILLISLLAIFSSIFDRG